MKKIVNYVGLILVLGFFFQGCVQKVALTPEVKKNIDTIEVDSDIKVPELPFLMTRGDALGIGLFGAIGGAAVGVDLSAEEKLKVYLQQNEISIKKIYREKLIEKLESNDLLKNKLVENNANYKLKSYINLYGLVYHHNIFSSDYKPTMNVKLELVDKNGKVVWSNTDFVTSYNEDTTREPFEKYFKDSKLMENALSSASNEVIKLLLQEFKD